MQPSARQAELERLFNARKGHVPHISISDDNHHVTEAIGSYYDDYDPDDWPTEGTTPRDTRPLSYISSSSEKESYSARSKRQGSFFETPRSPLADTQSNERLPSPTSDHQAGTAQSPKSLSRMGSLGAENQPEGHAPSLPPPLTRQASSETAVQPFPLNDIDYESSPAAVAQELSNLQAIRRMSMNVDAADPDLPSFASIPAVAPKQSDSDSDASKLFWVPARLHPELAPKEFKTFIEDRVGKIRRRSGGEDSLSPETLERSTSGSSLRRKKSMLSHQIDTKGNYEDGAERLERKRSKGMHVEGQATVANLSELEELVNEPSELLQRMSLDTARRSQDSAIDVPPGEDMPILPPTHALKRSTRTNYRRGSLKKGERVPFSKRVQQRQSDQESEDSSLTAPGSAYADDQDPRRGFQRTNTDPVAAANDAMNENYSRPGLRRQNTADSEPRSRDEHARSDLSPESQLGRGSRRERTAGEAEDDGDYYSHPSHPDSQSHFRADQDSSPNSQAQSQPLSEASSTPSQQQPRQFHSRIASAGRTTAQLPGYTNSNPLPQIIETLPDGTKVPASNLIQNIPVRKSSHEVPRQYQRGGAHTRPAPGRSNTPTSTLEDISSRPSPLPGSGSTRTDALTVVPTFDEKKSDKKDGSRKSSWKWILGNDDDDKDKKAKDEKVAESTAKPKSGKLSKNSMDNARLDVLQNSIDGNVPPRGRESLVLNRDEIKLEPERPKSGKKSSDVPRKDKDTSLLSAIFGGKKKSSSDSNETREKKRKSDRNLSPDPILRILKPDVDYNWTRFSILEERAIYRMAHIKLANPRRALHSQVLLSNFMYSYLAKVQMMHPQIQIPGAQRGAQQQKGQQGDEQQQQQQQQQREQQDRPAEYNQYLRWQEQQARQDAAMQEQENDASANHNAVGDRHPYDSNEHDNHAGYDQSHGHDRHAEESYNTHYAHRAGNSNHHANNTYNYDRDREQDRSGSGTPTPSSRSNGTAPTPRHGRDRASSIRSGSAPSKSTPSSPSSSAGYSVASTHDYLGYPRNDPSSHDPLHYQSSHGQGLWDDDDDDDRTGELW